MTNISELEFLGSNFVNKFNTPLKHQNISLNEDES